MTKIYRLISPVLFAVTVFFSVPGTANALTILRDDEIERFLKDLSTPIFEAAGLNPSDISMVLVGDDAVNAYVAGGQNIFIYSGLIEKTENVEELAGVIAHETGHIASGHLVRGSEALEKASYQAILSAVLGVAVGVASGDFQAGTGVSLGGAEAARRNFLKNSRTFEASADQSALTYLAASGYSVSGLSSFLKKLEDQEVLPESQQDEYVLTHPVSANRIKLVDGHIEKMNRGKVMPQELQEKFYRIREKVAAYQHPERTVGGNQGKTPDIALKYGRAIAAYRTGDIPTALRETDALSADEPKNPYFYELKGQILFGEGRINEAVVAYRKSYEILPDSGLIALALSHALVEKNTPETDREAVSVLEKSLKYEKRSPEIYRFLSVAYGRSGNEGAAKLCLAEEAMLRGNVMLAGQQAVAATKLLEKNSPAWNRARDLIKLVKNTKM